MSSLNHGIVCTHTDPYVQCHVTSEVVSRLLGGVISLMKHVTLHHGIFGTHISIHAMSISCNNTDCISSSW